MTFSRKLLSPLAATAILSLSACDVVQFPGAGEPEERAGNIPPPPPTEAVNPIPISDEVLQNATTNPSDETETSESSTDSTHFDDITNLLSINAAKCAQSPIETMTFAEQIGAAPATSSVTTEAVNATSITAADFPGIVKMEPRRMLESGGTSSGHCGATRIAENWFVTAAHCLDNTYDEIRLIATDSDLRSPFATRVEATATLCHSSYGGAAGQYANDVALVGISDADALTLESVPIARFGGTQNPLSPMAYPTVRMAGWGLTGFNGSLSNTLLSAELAVVASGPAAITVASKNNAGPCIGDSGGPLLVDDTDGQSTVIGVLSVVEQNRTTGEFCSGDYNARYTNLQGYTDWIESVIGTCSSNPALCTR